MTLQELIQKWKVEIANWDVKNLKADDEFMADCINYGEFAEYVLSVKPEIKSNRPPKIKFLGLGGNMEQVVEKQPDAAPVAPEPVEEIPKAIQYYRDVVAMQKKLL